MAKSRGASYPKALDYGALTANFAPISTVASIAPGTGAARPVYQLNSINPFRLEGQKTLALELLEQLDWLAADHIA